MADESLVPSQKNDIFDATLASPAAVYETRQVEGEVIKVNITYYEDYFVIGGAIGCRIVEDGLLKPNEVILQLDVATTPSEELLDEYTKMLNFALCNFKPEAMHITLKEVCRPYVNFAKDLIANKLLGYKQVSLGMAIYLHPNFNRQLVAMPFLALFE